LVDLPGYGYAKVSKAEKARWAELVEGYLSDKRNIALIIQIVDIRHKPTKDDYDMLKFLYDSNAPFVIVLTKKDKLKKTAYEKRIDEVMDELEGFEGVELIPFSAVNGDGLDDVKEVIEEYISFMEDE
jgi:GTP-binding protein